MRISISKDFIDAKTLQAALNSMIYTSSDLTPLYELGHLQFVQERMMTLLLPACFSRNSRIEVTIHTILTEMIEERLTTMRYTMGYVLPPSDTLEQAQSDIIRDVKTGSPELIGFSYLYHRYLRPDLNMTQAQFAKIAHLTTRTLNRYQSHVERRLLHLLIQEERAVIAGIK